MKTRILGVAALALALSPLGCEDKSPPPPMTAPTPAPNTATTPPSTGGIVPVSPEAAALGDGPNIAVLGVSVTLPTGWKRNPPANQMRLAEADVPDASGDAAKSCLVVFSTAGGTVEGNIARWSGQVRDAQGQPVPGTPTTKAVNGVNVTIVEMTGTFAGMGDGAPKENWTLRGAIVDAPQGLLFIKMTGPAASMTEHSAAFNTMIDGIKKS